METTCLLCPRSSSASVSGSAWCLLHHSLFSAESHPALCALSAVKQLMCSPSDERTGGTGRVRTEASWILNPGTRELSAWCGLRQSADRTLCCITAGVHVQMLDHPRSQSGQDARFCEEADVWRNFGVDSFRKPEESELFDQPEMLQLQFLVFSCSSGGKS